MATPLHDVTATCQGEPVATHERCWASRQVVTDPAHIVRAQELRDEHDAIRVGANHRSAHLVPLRDLAGYDELFGVPDLRPRPRLEVVS